MACCEARELRTCQSSMRHNLETGWEHIELRQNWLKVQKTAALTKHLQSNTGVFMSDNSAC